MRALEAAVGKGFAGMSLLVENQGRETESLKAEVSGLKDKQQRMAVDFAVTKARVDDLRDERGEITKQVRTLEITDAKGVPETERAKASMAMKSAVLVALISGIVGLIGMLVQLLRGG